MKENSRQTGSEPGAHFIRHSKSGYETYKAIERSGNPLAPLNPEEQVVPDLTEEGRRLARESASTFFQELNPQENALFFVSSNEARALETADIYRQTAQEMGFRIMKPDKSGTALADRVTRGMVRVIDNLSLNPRNTLLLDVFLPESSLRPVNWNAVDDAFKEKWNRAREIIRHDDRGSYGANLHAHGAAIKEIFPESATTQEMHERQFPNLLRLLRWAERKFHLQQEGIKVIAFGHENYVLEALQAYLEEEGINNCEAIGFELEDGTAHLSFRGKTAEIKG